MEGWKHKGGHFGWSAVILAASLVLIWQVREILLLLFAGVVLGVVLKRLRRYLEVNTGWPNAVCMLALLVALGAVGVLLWYLVAPPLIRQMASLVDAAPALWQNLVDRVESTRWLGDWWSRNQDEVAGTVTQGSSEGVGWAMTMIGTMLTSSVGLLTALIVVFGIGFYLAVESRLYVQGMVRLVPSSWEKDAGIALHRAGDAITGWLLGQLGSMLFVGLGVALGLWMLGVPHAMALGVLAGTLAFVPNLGPIAAFFPAVLVALGESGTLALYTAVLYVAVQALEGNLVTPLFQRKVIAMPPALLLAFQVIAGAWAGLAGLLVAAPLLATILALTQYLWVEMYLGKPAGKPLEQSAADGELEESVSGESEV